MLPEVTMPKTKIGQWNHSQKFFKKFSEALSNVPAELYKTHYDALNKQYLDIIGATKELSIGRLIFIVSVHYLTISRSILLKSQVKVPLV